jgi:hypothetical protein
MIHGVKMRGSEGDRQENERIDKLYFKETMLVHRIVAGNMAK